MNALISLSRCALMLPKPLSARQFSALKTHPKAWVEYRIVEKDGPLMVVAP